MLFPMIISLFFYNCSVDEVEQVKEEKENTLMTIEFANNLKANSLKDTPITPLSIELSNNLSIVPNDEVNTEVRTVTEPLVIEEWNSMIELHGQSSKGQDGTDLYESPISSINLEISGMFKLHEND